MSLDPTPPWRKLRLGRILDTRRRIHTISAELSLLREKHRYVLSWQSLGTRPFQSFLVSLKPADMRRLEAVLGAAEDADDSESAGFESSDGDLRVRAEGTECSLTFRRRGENVEGRLVLRGQELAELRAALGTFRSL